MNVFKEVMGFLLLGTTVYLFTTFRKLNPSAVNGALWWFLFLSFSAWLTGKARNPLSKKLFRISGQAAALIIAVSSAFLFVDFSGTPSAAAVSSLNDKTGENTVAFSEKDVLDRINSGEPVFLEFTASWCTTCKVNQRVLHNEKIKALMKQKDIVHIKGDLTSYDKNLTAWLKKFGRVGVPLYVFYPPGKNPVVFPELLTLEGLEKEFNKIDASAR
jgi:thiol:disulfide interchange protein DsbD